MGYRDIFLISISAIRTIVAVAAYFVIAERKDLGSCPAVKPMMRPRMTERSYRYLPRRSHGDPAA